MEKSDIVAKWQTALRKYFPGVIVGWNRGLPDEPETPWLDVFMVPDSHTGEFARFFIYEAPKIIGKEQLPDIELMSHSVTVTRERYPDIWRQALSESSASAQSAPRKPRAKARRSSAGKKAVHAR